MADTPEAAAREVAMELAQTIADHATFYCLHCGQYGDDCKCEKPVQDRARDRTADAIAAALLAFRRAALEDAAKVAQGYPDTAQGEFHSSGATCWNVSQNIASAIRALAGSTKEGE